MKKLLFFLILFSSFILFSQEETEIYVFDISPAYEGLALFNQLKISTNVGYNNQPSFASNETVLFAGNNNGQTDISEYNLNTKTQKWINNKTEESEFSPQKFPANKNVAAVKLDENGLQRLYNYNYETGNSSEISNNLQVAYFAFYTEEKIICTLLNGNTMDLALINLKNKTTDTLFRNAGRSLQKVPKTSSISYTLVNEAGNLDLYLLDMNILESFFVCELPIGIQDYIWITDTQILIGSGNKIYMYDTLGKPEWNKVASLEEYKIKDITRMAISPNGKKLALVGNTSN